MKLAIRFLAILALAGALASSALACPVWMSASGHNEMPCSGKCGIPGDCPVSICQGGTPYLDTHSGPELLSFQDVALDLPVLRIANKPASFVNWAPAQDHALALAVGPLYLRTHSLLI